MILLSAAVSHGYRQSTTHVLHDKTPGDFRAFLFWITVQLGSIRLPRPSRKAFRACHPATLPQTKNPWLALRAVKSPYSVTLRVIRGKNLLFASMSDSWGFVSFVVHFFATLVTKKPLTDVRGSSKTKNPWLALRTAKSNSVYRPGPPSSSD